MAPHNTLDDRAHTYTYLPIHCTDRLGSYYLFAHLPAGLSTDPRICLPIDLLSCPCTQLSNRLPIHVLIYQYIHNGLSTHASICPSVHPSIYLSICQYAHTCIVYEIQRITYTCAYTHDLWTHGWVCEHVDPRILSREQLATATDKSAGSAARAGALHAASEASGPALKSPPPKPAKRSSRKTRVQGVGAPGGRDPSETRPQRRPPGPSEIWRSTAETLQKPPKTVLEEPPG